MPQTVAVLLPLAIGFALSPIPVIELILVLVSRRRIVNTWAFIVALLVGTALPVALGVLGGQASESDVGPSTLVRVVMGALGLVLLVVGLTNWRNRADSSEPQILATIHGMGPLPVAMIAVGIGLFNPKNLALLLTAGQAIGESAAPLAIGIVFVVVATSPYLVVSSYSLAGGAAAQERLDRLRAWLIVRNRLIIGIVSTVLGLLIIVKALA